MKILIIGGGGLIGQAIAKLHQEHGDEIYIYDTRENAYNDYTHLIGEDVTHLNLHGALSLDYDALSLQSALVGVGQSMYQPRRYLFNNVEGYGAIIQWLLDHKKNVPIIHAGSMGPYGEGQYICSSCGHVFYPTRMRTGEGLDFYCPICGELALSLPCTEETRCNPQSYYALSKYAQEESLRLFHEITGNPMASLRYFSVYGTEQNPLNPYTGVLTILANQYLNQGKVVINEDGKQTRDLIHVDDVAAAHYAVTCHWFPKNYQVYNVCTSASYDMSFIAERMGILLYKENIPIEYTGSIRKGDIRHSRGMNNKLYELGWRFKHNLQTDLIQYCDYVLNNKDRFQGDTWEQEQARLREKGVQ